MIIILINSIFISTQGVPEVASAVAIVVVVVVVVVVMGGDGGGGGCGGWRKKVEGRVHMTFSRCFSFCLFYEKTPTYCNI